MVIMVMVIYTALVRSHQSTSAVNGVGDLPYPLGVAAIAISWSCQKQ